MKRTVAETKAWLAAERTGEPFLCWDDECGDQHILSLADTPTSIGIGRREGAHVWLAGDRRVSRTHASLERMGADWVIMDAGLSRNGTWVNGRRVAGRQRLGNGDHIRVGKTTIVFSDPRPHAEEAQESTDAESVIARIDLLTPAQRGVLDALCAPMREIGPYAPPASNTEIAESLSLSLDSVKGHLRILFRTFGLSALPQSQKRGRLAEIGVKAGFGRG